MAKSPLRVVQNAASVAALSKIYLDGVVATGDTYFVESSANALSAVVGGTIGLTLSTSGLFTYNGQMYCYGAAGGAFMKLASPNYGLVIEQVGDSGMLRIRRADGATTTIADFSTSGLFTYNGQMYCYGAAGGAFMMLASPNYGLAIEQVGDSGMLRIRRADGATTTIADFTTAYLGLGAGVDLIAQATQKLRLDGSSSGDTYITESSANVIDIYAGGTKSLSLTASKSTFATDVQVPTKTPVTAGATGVAGTIAWDANYVYICTATNTWKRAALSTW